MTLRLAELLDDPTLGLELVAGARGLDERGPVRWAHISEIPDPTPWLEGGEVLLTTGLGVKDDEGLQRALVAGLDERGCAGIGFGLGVWLDAVPPALLAEADDRRLPLFTVPYEVPFLAVTKTVSRHVSAEHYATLHSAVDLHRAVLAAVLGGRGSLGVLKTVAARMPGWGWKVLDAYGALLVRHDPQGRCAQLDLDALRAQLSDGERPGPPPACIAVDDGRVVTAVALRPGEEVEAFLLVVGERAPSEHETLLVQQAAAGLSLELARGSSAREARRVRVDELLDELTDRAAASLERRLERLGLDLAAPLHVLAVQAPAGVAERAVAVVVEDVLAAQRPPLLGRRSGALCALVQPADSDAGERIVRAARARGWRDLRVGRSRPTAVAGLPAALAEAGAALAHAEAALAQTGSAADGVADVSALGLPGLVATLAGEPGTAVLVEQVLGPLLRYDRRESATLVQTLRAYLAHGCRPGPAAEQLRVHRHTLAYRLDRIRDLTGQDPRDGASLLSFALALELTVDHPPNPRSSP